MSVISTEKLCKSYGTQQVLSDVELNVGEGKIVGFLGPNGAGKTTTIRILLGLISASSGNATIFERSCRTAGKEIRRETGYLPGDVHFYPGLTGRKTLEFFSRARRRNCSEEIDRLSERFGLELDKTVRKYSTGMRQKLGLIQALMHRPQLLVLDEPTSGLDPLVRSAVFEELRGVSLDGRTVLFSSHSLDEVEDLCDEAVILRSGRIVEHQTIDAMRARALRRVQIVFAENLPSKMPVELTAAEPANRRVSGAWTGSVATLLAWLKPFQVEDLVIERPDLNDLFVACYREPDFDEPDLPEKGEREGTDV